MLVNWHFSDILRQRCTLIQWRVCTVELALLSMGVRAAADISDKGIARGDGMMVNCRYDLNKVEQNRKDFASTQKITATATMVSLANASSALRVGER